MSISSTIIPIPAPLKPQSSAHSLKERLDWGEPALTIVDIRSRDAYNKGRITGAISVPMDDLVAKVSVSLELQRDIYIYGETDEQAAQAAENLRQAGYQNVSQLIGGFAGWTVVNGAVEGSDV